MKKTIIIASLIPILIGLVFGIKSFWSGYVDDNPIEQTIEEIIEHESGIKVDLTPDSKLAN